MGNIRDILSCGQQIFIKCYTNDLSFIARIYTRNLPMHVSIHESILLRVVKL